MSKLLCLFFIAQGFLVSTQAQEKTDYVNYHKSMLVVEQFIIAEKYEEALAQINEILTTYDYVFLKEYKIATQLALYLKDFERAFKYLKLGVGNGWTLKAIKKNKFIKPLTAMKEWRTVKSSYEAIRSRYHNQIDQGLRKEVQEMYKKDQKFAFKYLFKIGQKAKERYGSKKGVQHLRQQLAKLNAIMKSKGYPGEKLIGESEWMTIILAHHNSVSKEFVVNDTLYPRLRPKLVKAISKGEMSPYDLAFIEDWNIAVKSDRQDTGYGYIDLPSKEEISKSNALRTTLNIRSIETRNGLVDIQEKTGMNFYLAGAGWLDGKIDP